MGAGRTGLGIFGGTFDPPHLGHLAIAEAVREALDLDEVLLVVANEPWQKVGARRISAAGDRLEMVRAATEGLEGITASAIEIERGGPSYMVDTLLELSRKYPTRPLFLIVGADAAGLLTTWVRHEELPALATLVIVGRPGSDPPMNPPGWKVIHVDGPGSTASSSEIREVFATGVSVEHLVPGPVLTLIRQRGLYGVAQA